MKSCPAMGKIISLLAQKHGLDLAASGVSLRLDMLGFDRLIIDKVSANLLRVGHYYEQADNLIADPEILFFIDGSDWIPFEITQVLGGLRTYGSVTPAGDSLVISHPRQQASLVNFAKIWAGNLESQGWLEHATKTEPARDEPGSVFSENLYFLWHPGTDDIFSGYGLTLQPDRLDWLAGLLMVDRPHPVDPAWLAEVTARFGEYRLYEMTATGERGIACQMYVEPESREHLWRFDHRLDDWRAAVAQALTVFLGQPPKPRFNVRWDETQQLWVSQFREPLFKLGQMGATVGALEALREAGQDPTELLTRHQFGDWGEVPPEDAAENEVSVKQGFRILSAYTLKTGVKVWLISEADRSATTILLPREY